MTRRSAPALALLSAILATPAVAQRDGQSILGPGLYVFQTRTVSATCGDDERTGYVHTFIAPIHGVPGDREMRMQLTNSPYWPTWTIRVGADGAVTGEAVLGGEDDPGPSTPRSRFEVRRDGERFTGRGSRSYVSDGRRCTVTYDALLRRFDV